MAGPGCRASTGRCVPIGWATARSGARGVLSRRVLQAPRGGVPQSWPLALSWLPVGEAARGGVQGAAAGRSAPAWARLGPGGGRGASQARRGGPGGGRGAERGQRGKATRPWPHSWSRAESGLAPRPGGPRGHAPPETPPLSPAGATRTPDRRGPRVHRHVHGAGAAEEEEAEVQPLGQTVLLHGLHRAGGPGRGPARSWVRGSPVSSRTCSRRVPRAPAEAGRGVGPAPPLGAPGWPAPPPAWPVCHCSPRLC